ncbi:hypothetical protein J2D73_20375, partial [Acetobacter sacchari]
ERASKNLSNIQCKNLKNAEFRQPEFRNSLNSQSGKTTLRYHPPSRRRAACAYFPASFRGNFAAEKPLRNASP